MTLFWFLMLEKLKAHQNREWKTKARRREFINNFKIQSAEFSGEKTDWKSHIKFNPVKRKASAISPYNPESWYKWGKWQNNKRKKLLNVNTLSQLLCLKYDIDLPSDRLLLVLRLHLGLGLGLAKRGKLKHYYIHPPRSTEFLPITYFFSMFETNVVCQILNWTWLVFTTLLFISTNFNK